MGSLVVKAHVSDVRLTWNAPINGKLTVEVILSIMQEEKPNQREQFKMPKERISKYFAPGTPAQKIEDTIIKALELYRRRERQRDMER